MSADKRKRFHRACALLREVNTGAWHPFTLSGRHRKNRTIRYIVERGMARIVRLTKDGPSNRRTVIDTGFPWSKEKRR